MNTDWLLSAVILLLAAILSVPISRRLGLGSVLGYLLAGVLIGPFVLGLINDEARILGVAEFGVVMMLFIVGLELSPTKLWRLRRTVFGAGSAQVFASTALLGAVAFALGLHFKPALIIGFGLALSSTAAALQILAERRELASSGGRTAISISLFQDIASLPVLAVMPLFAVVAVQQTGESHGWSQAGMALGAMALLIIGGRFLLKPIFNVIARQQSTELFTATTLLVVFATAWVMHHVGLSMALGAFIAGVLLSESEHRHELEADLEPFKGLLLGLFFMAIGMGMNFTLLARFPLEMLGALVVMLLLKGVVLIALAKALKFDRPGQLAFATTLAQGSEFAFVLFAAAQSERVLTRTQSEFLILLVALSMAVTPLVILLKDRLTKHWTREPTRPFDDLPDAEPRVIVAGFGRFGQIIARVLLTQRVPFTALEKSQEQVDFVRRFGNRIYYGDAARLELLRAAKADRAELLVLAIDDVEGSVAAATLIRKHFPALKILARARNRNHAFRLMDLGIEVVIRDTLFSSLKMSEHVLMSLGLPESLAKERVDRFRQLDQRALEEQAAFYQDEAKIIASAKDYTRQLEQLFENDSTELNRDRF